MTLPRLLWLVVSLLITSQVFAEIGVGDSRNEVIRQAGQPTSRAKRGDREILLYPHGGRVELIDGKVAEVKGPLPNLAADAAPVTMANDDQAGATTASAPATPPTPPTTGTKSTLPPTPKASPQTNAPIEEDGQSAAADRLAKHVEKMDTAWGERPQLPDDSTRFAWPKLLVSLGLHFGITLLALRIAFKIEEMDALWTGTLAIAGIDAAIYGTLEALGPLTNGLSSMGALESGIGALAMIYTIQKFCINKRLQNAVITAMSVKLIVRLCHMFLFVLVLNALFG